MANKATVSVGLDISSLKKSLGDALGQLNKFTGQKPNVKVSVDSSEVDAADKKIDGLSSTKTVKIDVDTKGAESSAGGLSKKLGGLGALAGGALGGAAAQALSGVVGGLKEGALAADEFGDSLEVAFTQQGIADVEGEIESVRKSSLGLANDLGLPVERTRELAARVASVSGVTGKAAEDLTKLSASVEVFSNGAVSGEAVLKAFNGSLADPENQATLTKLAKQFPELASVINSTATPAEKAAKANEVLAKSYETVKEQQSDVGGILNKLQNQLGEVFEKIGTQLLEALIPIAQSLLPILESILPVLQGILTPLAPILAQVGGAIATIVQSLSGPFLSLISAILEPMLGLIQQLVPVLLQVIQVAMKPLTDIVNILAQTFRELFPALQPIFDVILQLLPIVAQLAGELLTALVPVIKSAAGLFVTLVKAITTNKVIMAALNLVLQAAIGIIRAVVGVVQFFAGALDAIIKTIDSVIQYITRLINAIASFDLNTIKNALLGIDEPAKAASKSVGKVTDATDKAAGAADNLAAANTKAAKTSATGESAADKAKKYAEALAKATDQLAGLTAEQQKARELAGADDLASEEERAKKRIEIEQRYALQALEVERKALTSKGELRKAEEAVINKRIEILREENARKIEDIEAKARQNALKLEEENQKKLDDITAKFAATRLDKLKAQLAAGNASVAGELISAQRAVLESGLSNALDAIVEQTPEYQKGIAELQKALLNGLSVEEFRSKSAALRQGIFQELQQLPSDTTNIYAKQIQAAYTSAGDEIAKGTAEIVAQIRQQQVKQAGDIFADSLRGIGEALRSVDFATIYGDAATQAASLNEEQEKLIQNLKDGETTYQDAVGELQNLSSQQEQTASATAQAIAASFQAIADQQAKAAEGNAQRANELLVRNQEIAAQVVELEKLKAAELQAIAADDVQKRLQIEQQYTEAKKKLTDESAKNTTDANDLTSASYANLAASAAASFTSMVLQGDNALQALVVTALDALNALVPVLVAQITGVQLASPNPANALTGGAWGLASAAALTAALYAAVAAAKAAVQGGFMDGGYTGDVGTSQVAGVVHGQEFVMTADVTRKNRALLEHLHSGKSVESFPALQKMLAENQISTIPVTELQLMRGELSAIRQRLDSMPNGIQGQMGVDVNVGMDAYLYEKDRTRMIARKLRG